MSGHPMGFLGVARTRSGALLVAAAALASWGIVGFPAGHWAGVAAIGLALVVLLARFAHQQRSERRHHDRDARRRAELEGVLDDIGRSLTDFRRAQVDFDGRQAKFRGSLEELNGRLGRTSAQLDAAARRVDEMEADLLRREQNTMDLAREGLGQVRRELDDIARRLPSDVRGPIDAEVADPLVSIAIPVFNRPDFLTACLDSIVSEIEAAGTDRVEVWVTDDASTIDRAAAIAHSFAQTHAFVGFRANATNLGLERNLIACCRPCRGQYLWIVGSDDLVHQGGIATVLADAAAGDHDVLLYDKVRIDNRGNEIGRTPGCLPADIVPGDRRSYATTMELAQQAGILSALGFISTLVMRRTRYLSASVEPYLGLTMYPQVGMLLETCGSEPLLLNCTPVVYHRTTTTAQKLADSLGRREETFMAGGDERRRAWFGDSLAALLQRVVERSALRADDLARVPELLFGHESLIGFIEHNRRLVVADATPQPDDVLADAQKFLAAVR